MKCGANVMGIQSRRNRLQCSGPSSVGVTGSKLAFPTNFAQLGSVETIQFRLTGNGYKIPGHSRTGSLDCSGAVSTRYQERANGLPSSIRTGSIAVMVKEKIGNRGAQALSEALKTNSTLTTLDFWGNSIGYEGAVLAEALKTSSNLAALKLQGSEIKDTGAQALAEALKISSTLTCLYLQNNLIGDIGAKALAEALKTNLTR
ncbi:hypothetical protein BG006_001841 [Podila minutissima]|uniref:Uncharacterized protein n=1 Tax=Podila minutissima TaxID=64525 RepID=A0A9P5SSU1_9FUNG|nr:hypothetical protein BG006_001841 [Podila minutissima]